MSQRASDQAIQVKPLAGHIGAEIHGADISKPLPDEAVAAIRAALLEWKVVFFRGQTLGHAGATAHLGPQDLGHLDVERVLYRVTLTGDIPVGVDGVRSEIVAGEPFGKRPPSKVKAARKDGALGAEVQA
ncbi:TauD/TfdA family dioxygenase [Sorangium sp. So ce1097]